ncbi:type II secretion system F family protein [Pelagibius litoralis]|uniref:Type II secretion system F family protein n=1 Tax=Pelagibius litoralis TaxID=374515 RepID=A0A967EX16_9PROT|nr:type II secretion system F family protein [Pelagibius litoralis]NIA67205.1 type II secretion system F family protein [Pelagibius litoralis]
MTLEDLLPAGVSIENLLVAMSGISVLISVLAIWFSLLHRDVSSKRAKTIADQRRSLRASIMTPTRREVRLPSLTMMHKVVDKLKLLRSAQAKKVGLKLMQAGWRSNDAVVRFFFFKLALPFAFGGVSTFMLYGLEAYSLGPAGRVTAALGAVIFGAYLPDIIVRNAAEKRRTAIRKSLPDALDLMVICSEAGLALDATLARVAREMEKTAPELADEFNLTALELGFLPDRRVALQNLALRTDITVLRGMVGTLLQAERYGTPLAHALRVLSAESREERAMRAEEKAARLPALLTVPMIVFILPPLFIVLIGPAALRTMDSFGKM